MVLFLFSIFSIFGFIYVSLDIKTELFFCLFDTKKPKAPLLLLALKALIFKSSITIFWFFDISMYSKDAVSFLYRFIFSKFGQIRSLKRCFFRSFIVCFEAYILSGVFFFFHNSFQVKMVSQLSDHYGHGLRKYAQYQKLFTQGFYYVTCI